jgi:hypothetical protein
MGQLPLPGVDCARGRAAAQPAPVMPVQMLLITTGGPAPGKAARASPGERDVTALPEHFRR